MSSKLLQSRSNVFRIVFASGAREIIAQPCDIAVEGHAHQNVGACHSIRLEVIHLLLLFELNQILCTVFRTMMMNIIEAIYVIIASL